MRANAVERRQQARQAKQKKLLIALVPVLIATLAFAVPRTLKQLRGAEAAPAAPTAAAPATAGPAAPAAGEAPAEGGAAASDPAAAAGDPAVIAASARQVLEDTDAPPPADEGQLISFTRFEARDPFVQLVDDQPEDTSTTDASGSVPATTTPTVTTPPATTTSTTTTGTTGGSTGTGEVTEVRITVNGTVSILAVGDTFPEDDPAFKVVSVSADSVEIGLVSGSFSTGVETITLTPSEAVTLISQPDGARYTIKFVGPA